MNPVHEILEQASTPGDAWGLDPDLLVREGRLRVRRRTRVRVAIATAAAVVAAGAVTFGVGGLDGLGVRGDRGAGPAAPTGGASAEPSRSPSDGASGPRGDGADTPPGSALALGEAARVPVQHLGRGEVDLALTSVTEGDRADVLALPDLDPSLREGAERGRFWYVRMDLTYRAGDIGGYYLSPDVEPVVSGGRLLSTWNQIDAAGFPCRTRGLPLEPEPGVRVSDCLVFQTTAGATVEGVSWGQLDSVYDPADGGAITWR